MTVNSVSSLQKIVLTDICLVTLQKYLNVLKTLLFNIITFLLFRHKSKSYFHDFSFCQINLHN